MNKSEILEKLQLPGRQLSRDVLEVIQHNPDTYRSDLLKILNQEADNPQNPCLVANFWWLSML